MAWNQFIEKTDVETRGGHHVQSGNIYQKWESREQKEKAEEKEKSKEDKTRVEETRQDGVWV